MASAKNPIANRIKGHRQQVRGMLTPGLSGAASGGNSSRARFTHFGVGKAKLAATKMRFLDHRRMGKVQSESTKTFSETIPQKFQQAQTLLRINPRMSRETSIWSEIDQTLPAQGGSTYEEPAQPGELRAGSVIQKFSMFPKEGQSIESFKEQAKSLPKPPSRQPAPRPKPAVTPKSRLFSRVQEVPPSQPAKKADETPKRPPEKPASVKPETVQRQTDPVSPPPKRDAPAPQPKTPPVPEPETKPEPVQEETSQEPVAKEEKRPAAKPVGKVSPPSELPLKKVAKPVKKATKTAPPTVQRKVDTKSTPPAAQPKAEAKPVAKPAQPKAEPKQTPPPVKQPPLVKTEKPAAKKQSLAEPTKETPESPPQAQKAAPPEKDSAVEAVEPRAKETPPAPPAEMPLRKNIQARREAPKAIKALRPETIKPAEQKPIMAPPPRPLISRRKYTRDEKPAELAPEPALQQQRSPAPETPSAPELPEGFGEMDSLLRERTGQKSAQTAPQAAEPVRDGRQQLPMALAKLPHIAQQAAPQAPPPENQLPPELRMMQPAKAPRQEEQRPEQRTLPTQADRPGRRLTTTSSISSQQVVQRQQDDDTSESESTATPPPNLDELAEEVLPYVKRILEIESERTPGRLR